MRTLLLFLRFVIQFKCTMRFFQPFSPPPPRLPSLGFVVVVVPVGFFSPLLFSSVTGACSFPFVWGLMAGLRCCASCGGIISV